MVGNLLPGFADRLPRISESEKANRIRHAREISTTSRQITQRHERTHFTILPLIDGADEGTRGLSSFCGSGRGGSRAPVGEEEKIPRFR